MSELKFIVTSALLVFAFFGFGVWVGDAAARNRYTLRQVHKAVAPVLWGAQMGMEWVDDCWRDIEANLLAAPRDSGTGD